MRIARPGAIYDASAAAQTFSTGDLVGFMEGGNLFWGNEEKEAYIEEEEEGEEEDFDRMPGFAEFKSKKQEVGKVNISKKNKKLIRRKRILR